MILAIVILVFGAAKLPELARGSGQALRIFKAETKGLTDDDDDDAEDAADAAPSSRRRQASPTAAGRADRASATASDRHRPA